MCKFDIPFLLFYTNVPALIGGVLLGFFILLSNKKSPVNKHLFWFIFFLCFGIANGMFQWLIHDININLFFSKLSAIEVLTMPFFFLFSLSFTGSQINNSKKILFFVPVLPVFAFLFSHYNAEMLDSSTCSVNYGVLYFYIYFLVLLYSFISTKKLLEFRKKNFDEKIKNQTNIIIGAIIFIICWVVVLFILSTLYIDKFWWGEQLLLFIPVGMFFFIGMLAYAITKYQFLKIKLLAAQALTYAIWLLIGSQYFFADNVIVYLLISLTLLLSIFFGLMLIKSIKEEEKRKEELQFMADKLAQANDQLRKLDNAKTEFISIASHQLRTPITAIKGFASLLLEGSYGELSEGVHGAMEKVYDSSERLVTLIEDLLNVSRIESGRMQFEFAPTKVEKLLRELYDNFILTAKTKKFFLDLKLPESPLPDITMDYSKIRELVSNFIDNALKYTESGGVTISAELRDFGVVIDDKGFEIPNEKSPFGKVVRISVKDTGIGIPKEEIPYLFKKFSRGKDVSRLHVGGTGLGLYVGKAIAEAHHGQVWVESEGDGKGSQFIIEIPIEAQNK